MSVTSALQSPLSSLLSDVTTDNRCPLWLWSLVVTLHWVHPPVLSPHQEQEHLHASIRHYLVNIIALIISSKCEEQKCEEKNCTY